MRITLYKNCKLNNKYSVVKHYSALESYLASLDKLVLTTDVAFVYQSNNGKINLELDYDSNTTGYDYNYIKFESKEEDSETYTFIRYAFIDSISISNGIATVMYSEDIWSSYSNYIHINNSFLSRSTGIYYSTTKTHSNTDPKISLYELPVEYASNNYINKTNVHTLAQGQEETYNIVLQFQVYETTAMGEANRRYMKTGLIHRNSSNTFTIKEAIETARKLILGQTEKNFFPSWYQALVGGWYYDVGNIYIIPAYLGIEDLFDNDPSSYHSHITYTSLNFDPFSAQTRELLDVNYGVEKVLFTKSITNNFSNMSIGTLKNRVDLVNNGTTVDMKIITRITEAEIGLFMEVNNNYIDITDDFELELPITSISGAEASQAKMSRALKTIGAGIDIALSALTLGDISGTIDTLKYTKTGRLTTSAKKLSAINQLEKQEKYQYGDIGNGIVGIIQTNAPVYTANSLIKVEKSVSTIINGIRIYSIVADNTSYVNTAINVMGYKVYELNTIISNYAFTRWAFDKNGTLLTSNAIKYDYINIYGNFSQNIARQLEDILLNGFIMEY